MIACERSTGVVSQMMDFIPAMSKADFEANAESGCRFGVKNLTCCSCGNLDGFCIGIRPSWQTKTALFRFRSLRQKNKKNLFLFATALP